MYVIYTAVLRAGLPCSRTKILICRGALLFAFKILFHSIDVITKLADFITGVFYPGYSIQNQLTYHESTRLTAFIIVVGILIY